MIVPSSKVKAHVYELESEALFADCNQGNILIEYLLHTAITETVSRLSFPVEQNVC